MLIYGKPIAESIKEEVKNWVLLHKMEGKYVAIVMIGKDHPGAAYVRSKEKFAERVGLEVKVLGNSDGVWTEVDIIQMIQKCNDDEMCIGIITQLPLPIYLSDAQQRINDAIVRYKDIDALSTPMHDLEHFRPATPNAVIRIIEESHFGLTGKRVAMIGYSNIIGRPLARILEKKEALVQVFTIESDQDYMKKFCHDEADIIISATGNIHLVTKEFVRDDTSQLIIDVGRGYKDGESVGDVDRKEIENMVFAVTPVPGGVGPVTVASLFQNIIQLHSLHNLLDT